jgi:hypothetical protein
LFDNIVTKNLKVAPIPPPTNTETNFKNIDFLFPYHLYLKTIIVHRKVYLRF